MLCSIGTSSAPSFAVANRKAKKGLGSSSDCGDVNLALADNKGPRLDNGIGGRCLVSVEAQAADDVRRFVRTSNIGRPKAPRQADEKSPTKGAPRVTVRQPFRHANGGASGSPDIEPWPRTNYKEFCWPTDHRVSNLGQCLLPLCG
jgi:hypothetical protein